MRRPSFTSFHWSTDQSRRCDNATQYKIYGSSLKRNFALCHRETLRLDVLFLSLFLVGEKLPIEQDQFWKAIQMSNVVLIWSKREEGEGWNDQTNEWRAKQLNVYDPLIWHRHRFTSHIYRWFCRLFWFSFLPSNRCRTIWNRENCFFFRFFCFSCRHYRELYKKKGNGERERERNRKTLQYVTCRVRVAVLLTSINVHCSNVHDRCVQSRTTVK